MGAFLARAGVIVQEPQSDTTEKYNKTQLPSNTRTNAGETQGIPSTARNCFNRGPYIQPKGDLHVELPHCDGKIYIVGDVHGCFDELVALLKPVNPAKDLVVIVGDLVNKGPKSLEVVRLAMNSPHVYSVRGNHEDYALMQLDTWRQKVEESKAESGDGKPTIGISEMNEATRWTVELTAEEEEYLRTLPYTISIKQYNSIIVHAGLVQGVPLKDQHYGLMYRIRNMATYEEDGVTKYVPSDKGDIGDAWAKTWKGPEHLYFGHDSLRGLQLLDHATGLDTSCCYGGKLTAMVLPERKVLQVDALRQYAPTH